jgi:predicted Zn-dependent peptidase
MRATRLANGVRVLSEELPDLASVAVGIWVENGSRYERDDQAGLSHYLEHLFFKGTERRSAAEIAEAVDAVGGVINAFTGREYTCYYAKVLAEHLPLALDVLGDIFTRSKFAEEEIDRERTVILQEISQVEDNPDEWVHDLFAQALWPGHPLARPIPGTADTVGGFHRADFLSFLGERYRPDRVIVAAAGKLSHDRLVDAVGRILDAAATTTPASIVPAPRVARAITVHEKNLEQLHVCIGTPGIGVLDPERYAARVLELALGGGMSSRLFQEIREKRGHAYTIYSFLNSYSDVGYFGVYVGTSADKLVEVLDLVRAEFRRVAHEGLTPRELERTKNQMKGNMLLGLETSDSRMTRLARNEIYHRRDVSLAEIAAGIDAVRNDDVVAMATRLLGDGPHALTILGDLRGVRLDDGVLGA